ncbi:MAG: vWA domain-containing protein [Phycisphaerales bacterium]
MRRAFGCLSACLLSLFVFQSITLAHEKPALDAPRPAVDIAILLDTSNSMDGLIDQAKGQLWTIVNEFAAAKSHGLTPVLRVALFEYGNTNLPAREGYIRQVIPLTDDLDALSEALFALTTNGGDEYCGQVIDEALKRLDWTNEPNAYKAIFIAGNEPFTQGPVDYKQACAYAIQHGVAVNTIHCGDYKTGIEGMWAHGAQLAEGKYLNIDQDRAVVHIDCPQDPELIRLNVELNATYLWYGKQGRAAGARQAEQDTNARSYGSANAAQRVYSKASSVYSNTATDLVDAVNSDSVDLESVNDADLPEAMRDMNVEERAAYVQEQAEKRAEIQSQIRALTAEREAYLAKERVKLAASGGDDTLGDAIVRSVREQLDSAGFDVKDNAAPE